MARLLFFRMKHVCSYIFVSKFPVVLVAMLGSTIPISIIGTKFAMSVTPFWDPTQFSKD